MPGTGAIPDHYSTASAWAAYRLPFAGTNEFVTSRGAGVAFEGEAPAGGAMPPVTGQPTGQPTPPATPPTPAPTPGATPEPDAMATDAGRRALQAERDRAEKAEKELEKLRAANQSESEKAIDTARKERATSATTKLHGQLRQTEVRSALRAAGLTNDKTLALAARAAEFDALKVEEDGSVKDLDKTVETFKKDHPEMFAEPKPAPGGQPTRGPQNGGTPDRPKTLTEAVEAHYAGQSGARPA
jgi:hypothetical protein